MCRATFSWFGLLTLVLGMVAMPAIAAQEGTSPSSNPGASATALPAATACLILTNGNDTFNGTARDDCVFAAAGDDVLFGNAGDDYLNGGSGNDVIDGGSGFDTCTNGPVFISCP